jgi:hypothetical protein
MGRTEDEHALRDAVLLTAPAMILGPPETCFWPCRRCLAEPARSPRPLSRSLPIFWRLDGMTTLRNSGPSDAALQSARAVPFAGGGPDKSDMRPSPGRRGLAFRLQTVFWPKNSNGQNLCRFCCPNVLAQLSDDRGQGACPPGNPAFAGALCLALVDGIEAACGQRRK